MKYTSQKKNRPDKPTHKINYKINYNTSNTILESHKFDLYLTYISQKTHSRPKPYRDGYVLLCPSHDDTKPSFTISQKADGTILMKCFAGCNIHEICRSINIEVKDLFPFKKQWDFHD